MPVQGSCHSLPVKTAACDAAILLCAMCNMDIPVALGEIARVLEPGAPLLVADVARISGDNGQCF